MTWLDLLLSALFLGGAIAVARLVWRHTFAPPVDPQLHERRPQPGGDDGDA